MADSEEEVEEGFERDWSGPWCRHWREPGDCDEVCKTCGHGCGSHDFELPGDCREIGCPCAKWEAP